MIPASGESVLAAGSSDAGLDGFNVMTHTRRTWCPFTYRRPYDKWLARLSPRWVGKLQLLQCCDAVVRNVSGFSDRWSRDAMGVTSRLMGDDERRLHEQRVRRLLSLAYNREDKPEKQ